jgi:Zn-dependent peptidase ImmA (M78 family)
MYCAPEKYKEMKNLIFEIYRDYGITEFPVDPIWLAHRMGFKTLAYSSYSSAQIDKMKRLEPDGFTLELHSDNKVLYIIFYNDQEPKGRQAITIIHEIKHILCHDDESVDQEKEALATYFAKEFLSPMPYMIWKKIDNVIEIQTVFGLSAEAAGYRKAALDRRREKTGDKIYQYEEQFISLFRDNGGP